MFSTSFKPLIVNGAKGIVSQFCAQMIYNCLMNSVQITSSPYCFCSVLFFLNNMAHVQFLLQSINYPGLDLDGPKMINCHQPT